jgi:hypothetical protein
MIFCCTGASQKRRVETKYKIMKIKRIKYALAGLGLAGVVMQNALAAPKEKPSPEIEAKLTQVIKSSYPDVVITKMGKETEDGLSFVEVAFTTKGVKMDADVMEDGTLVETEQAADIKTFPKPAAKALKKATKDMKIVVTEIATTYAKAAPGDTSGTKAVKLAEPIIAYEADVEKDGKKGEFSISADGTILESPKWAKSGENKSEDKD